MLDQETRDRIAKVKARQSHEAAEKRLMRDGSTSIRNVRRRLLLIAAERMLDAKEASAAARSWPRTLVYGKAHHISIDWVTYGDLKGLLRSTQEPRLEPLQVDRALATQ